MCIIIEKPADKKITREVLFECFDRNPDGAGIAYVENDELVVKKGIRTGVEFVKVVEELMDHHLLIHCRKASNTMIRNNDNCHPFLIKVREGTFQFAVAHNGSLEWNSTGLCSDTHMFCLQFMTPMFESHPFVLDYEWGRIALSRTILYGNNGLRANKMCIFAYDKEQKKLSSYILNSDVININGAGNWQDGIWYSNYSWRPIPKKETVGFFPGVGSQASSKDTKEKGVFFRFWCEPDANGWFWSFIWDAWVNAHTGTITRSFSRANPIYMNTPEYTPQDLDGRTTLNIAEVNHLLFTIRQNIAEIERDEKKYDENKTPTVADFSEDKQMSHLTAAEKGLICEKAVKVMQWEGGIGKKEIRKMSGLDKVKNLRGWIKYLFLEEPEWLELEHLTDTELDRWIVKEIKGGFLNMKKIDDLYVKRDTGSYGTEITQLDLQQPNNP